MKKIYLIAITLLITNLLYASKSIEIDLSKQKLYAKENGRVVFSGSISSGKSGHSTPRGNFRILEKERFHISNRYPEPNGGAKMPYMHRLTNKGIAIHQGYLPGYPASHGCIRVSKSTALKLWRWSKTGIKVKVYGDASNFRYVKKREKKKRRYAHKNIKSKKKYAKKRTYHKVSKKRYVRKKYRKNRANHYVKRDSGYQIVEIYDSW